jgi:large subunit ribosomal protein L25
MDELILRAEPRTVVGKKVKQLRRDGLIPGVVYGPGLTSQETVQVSVNRRDFDRFYMAHGHSTLFSLQWDGGSQTVFIREVQQEPVKRTALHIDFFAPNMRKELVAPVPVVLRHAAEHHEGIVNQVRAEIMVSALPQALPHEIDVDISQLVNVGDSIRVGDLTMPKGVTAVTPDDELLVLISAEAVAEPEEAPEAEEGEVTAEEAEGEAAEAEGNAAESES